MRLLELLNQPLPVCSRRETSYTWLFNLAAQLTTVKNYWDAKHLMEEILDEIDSSLGQHVRAHQHS